MNTYKYIFGPIPSRRLGISLGVDLVKHKFCTLDCVYCEVGRTTCLTLERKEYIPTSEILQELELFLSDSPKLDYITFSGAGEPTLHSGLEYIANQIKQKYPQYKLALITNGTLFYLPEVRAAVKNIDCILPSLDAVSETVFHTINRPNSLLQNTIIIDGLIKLRHEYSGVILLEIFIIPGLNDTEDELKQLINAVSKIKPDVVQLNTLDRPGTELWVHKPTKERLDEIALSFAPQKVEIVAKFNKKPIDSGYNIDVEFGIIEYLKRRPATMSDLCSGLSRHVNEISKYITHLLDTDFIESVSNNDDVYYRIKNN